VSIIIYGVPSSHKHNPENNSVCLSVTAGKSSHFKLGTSKKVVVAESNLGTHLQII